MKRLKDILHEIEIIEIYGDSSVEIERLTFDSREAAPLSCFCAIAGEVADGHKFIAQAVESGAAAILCEELPQTLNEGVTYIHVEDSHKTLALMASALYDHPSRELTLVGITGTNGKTTTATLLHNLFKSLGHKVGLISTVSYIIDGTEHNSTHTTPDAIRLNAMLREMVDCGCSHTFMEISSHAIVQHRTTGLDLDGVIFSNITHDHLDYHKTFAEYIKAKKALFDNLPKGAFALINEDDKNGRVMVQNTRAKVYSYSLKRIADFRAKVQEMHLDGMLLSIDNQELWVRLLGEFNAYNTLALYGAATLLGVEREELLTAISSLSAVDGRFEHLTSEGGITVIVDYAHTPDALEKCCETVREILPTGDFYVVCGCGGDRDKTKRPEMARIATLQATMSIFTSDNPRSESPEAIIADMVKGVDAGSKYLTIVDRRDAIRSAVMLAKAGDVILIAGKGHEKYQIIGSQTFDFNDKEVAKSALEEYKK